MGNVHINRGRLAPALILVALVVLAAVAGLGMIAGPANAQATFTACATCHIITPGDAFHSQTTHAAQTCDKCHTVGIMTPPAPSACASCHGAATTIIASQASHVNAGCGTTPGCHGVPAAVVATKLTIKVAPTAIKLHKTVKTSGVATPKLTLKGKKVALRVDFKKGAKWIKAKTGSATVAASGAYSWTYKPGKKGTFRVTASIAKTATYKAYTSKALTFKVK